MTHNRCFSPVLKCLLASVACLVVATHAHAEEVITKQPHVLLITHPRINVIKNYVTLVRQHVLNVENLRLVGIYHASESENYQETADYIAKEHLSWVSLHPIKCDLTRDNMFTNNACRPVFQNVLSHADGIVFNGGPDIPPSLYGEPTLLTTVIETPHRHIFEIALLVQMLGSSHAPGVEPLLAQRRDFPVLGICVGMQSLNVAAGGTLTQDIPSQIYGEHSVEEELKTNPGRWHHNPFHALYSDDKAVGFGVMHPIHFTNNAPAFWRLISPNNNFEPQVLSIHHQAVDALGPGYVVYATSDDGKIVESIGRHDFPNVLGIQFHPERSALWDKAEEQRMSPTSKTFNEVFDTLEHDAKSKAFNESIWQWFAITMQKQKKSGNHS